MKKPSQKTTKKRMTIEDLALMVARGFEETKAELKAEFRGGLEKVNQRFDTHIIQTAEGFEDAGKRFDSLEAGTHRRITLMESTVAGLMKREIKK